MVSWIEKVKRVNYSSSREKDDEAHSTSETLTFQFVLNILPRRNEKLKKKVKLMGGGDLNARNNRIANQKEMINDNDFVFVSKKGNILNVHCRH